MKLILAVVEDDDAARLMDALIENDFSATKLASTGGFLLRGNTTLLIGVQDDQVSQVLQIVGQPCVRWNLMVALGWPQLPASLAHPGGVASGGASVLLASAGGFHCESRAAGGPWQPLPGVAGPLRALR